MDCGPLKTDTKPSAYHHITSDSVNAVGIWQIPKKSRNIVGETEGSRWSTGPAFDRFIYDGTYVTIMLITEKAWMWKTPDDLYKVKSKWNNDTLLYLPPFGGQWNTLAIFKNDHFHYSYTINDSTYTWSYSKINETEIDSGYSYYTKPRKPHDYSIKPTDVYKE